ncbi:MAG: radical SAM protein [Ruminococcaceae bacterium]|nr:radical SAM protein [Oscillospiraceae bacterium]
MKKCTVCPRECRADRTKSVGICGEGQEMRIAKIMLHRWEEPCISGTDPKRGSGAVFFSGCPLHCVYCQNRDISSGGVGSVYTPKDLAEVFKRLEEDGAYNVNLVTPTHFTAGIIEALDIYRPGIPVVFNTSGYEKEDTLEALSGYADIFLTDLKYGGADTAKKYSAAPDYPEVALSAVKKMIGIAGKPRFDENGMMTGGVIVRLLVLPGQRRDAENALRSLRELVDCEDIILSLMSQYTPDFAPRDMGALCRRTTTFEYEYVRSVALELGFSGFGQDRQSAKSSYTPDFI